MRTKALLCAAALAAGAVSSMGQANVYSLNVVGYVNTTFKPGFNLVANPLNAADNHLGVIMKGTQVPDNTAVYIFDPLIQDFSPNTPTYVAGSQTWVPDIVVKPGQGIFVLAPAAYTNTFVGDVLQGSITNTIYPAFNVIASPVPVGGDVSVVLTNLPASDNDTAFKFDANIQDFGSPSTYVLGTHTWTPPLAIGVGEGILYLSTAATQVQWVRNFTVQ